MRRLVLPTVPLFALAALRLMGGCGNGTVNIAIPVYEASIPEGGSVFQDSGVDAHVADGTAPEASSGSDARDDVTPRVDSGTDASKADGASPDAEHDAAHEAGDAAKD